MYARTGRKPLGTILLITVLVGAFVAACAGSDDDPNGGNAGNGNRSGAAGAAGAAGSGGGASGVGASAGAGGGSVGGASGSAGNDASGGSGAAGGTDGGRGGRGGADGAAGTAGSSGGTAGTGGIAGTSGTAGTNGASGTAGSGGTNGASGTAGTGGTAGAGGTTPSTGCGKAPTLTSGMRSIQSSGKSRSFILRIPDGYDRNRAYRLIFGFHWNGGTANDVDSGGTSGYTWSYYGLREQANNSTIFVAPQGNGNGWANPGGEDLTFVDDMIKLIEGDLCVDRTRLFALGFSYGGGMSYAIACARPTVFRAVAVYSGGQLSGCSGGTQPIAYMGLHGGRDGRVTIAAGRLLRDKFVGNNGCSPQNPPEPSQGSLSHTCTSYAGCSSGHPVRWCAFDAGHTPAPMDGSLDESGGGDRTWTKGEVWRFFTQF